MEHNRFEAFRRMALSFPGVVEAVSYGTPSFKLKDKQLARFHEDGVSLVLKMDMETRDFVLQAEPVVYSMPDHYKKYPYVLVKLAEADMDELKGHFLRSWRANAPKKLLREHEGTLERE
ncbi:MmcQ/YjbR family DNA-binding protein [Paenibacillus arenilitoris]|uniref:MmcQ/YjbR family DNA-binding protein n=1 Tax=Paenibacillus arenilitoris TaxID=2772299 RepID=A0A927CKH6_9BACL|nr:MmcQ/YjbR family DNA-binding protein [Paenibacillus arenilitoris]MBD2868253.1 MmcQ/YjbR family DNA-binding protein [Paenibacillus arenilitoris]